MNALVAHCIVTAMAATAPSPTDADIAWVASGGFCEPETVLPMPDNTLMVSNVCGFSQPGSGFLSLLDAQGNALNWRILGGLDAPLGMALHQDRLFLIDNNHLKIFSWPGLHLQQTTILETTVANDLAISPDGMVFISDTAKGQVIQLRPDGSQSVLTGKAQFTGANGMAFDHGFLYVGGQRLWRIDLANGSVDNIGPEWLADIDGIELEADGTVQITPVGGPLVRYRSVNDVEIFAGPGISSANHGYAPGLGLALIPTGFDNTVIAIRIPAEKVSAHQPEPAEQ